MVPATTLADLNHVDPEFPVFGSHLVQFRRPLDPPCVLSEFIPVHIRDVCDIRPAADRALDVGRLAVVLGGPQQVRVSIADFGEVGPARADRCQGRPPGEPVVHHRTPRGHAVQSTSWLLSWERVRMLWTQHRYIEPRYRQEISARYTRTLPTGGVGGRNRTGVLEVAVLRLLHRTTMDG